MNPLKPNIGRLSITNELRVPLLNYPDEGDLMSQVDNIKSQLIEALQKNVEHRMSYHNHKEVMAWTASSLYFVFTAALVGWLFSYAAQKHAASFFNRHYLGTEQAFALVILFLVFLSAIAFVYMQFTARWIAADEVFILRRYVFNVLSKDENYAKNLLEISHLGPNNRTYPDRIERSIRRLKAKRNLLGVLKAALCLFSGRTDLRYWSEIPTYFLLVVLFLSQIATICYLK